MSASNIMYIRAVRAQTLNSRDTEDFGLVAFDNHGQASKFGYESEKDLRSRWPNKLAVARYFFSLPEFDGAGKINDSNEIELYSAGSLEFEGFDEGDVVKIIVK